MARNCSAIAWPSLLSVLLHGLVLAVLQRGDHGNIVVPRMVIEATLTAAAPEYAVLPARIEKDNSHVAVADELGHEPIEPANETIQSASPPSLMPPEPRIQKMYLGVAALHQRPIPLVRIELSELVHQYPGAKARLDVLINEKGGVDDVRVHQGSHPALAQAYEKQLRELRFVPGKIAGQTVASEMIIEIVLPYHVAPAAAGTN